MQFRKTISFLMLVALMTWTLSALCAPLPIMHGQACESVMYRTMVVQHPSAHNCCGPDRMLVVICYRMHGDHGPGSMRRCQPLQQDDALCATARYHDDGQARACAMADAINLLISNPQVAGANWERAGLKDQRSILDLKSDLRV